MVDEGAGRKGGGRKDRVWCGAEISMRNGKGEEGREEEGMGEELDKTRLRTRQESSAGIQKM